MRKSVKQFRRLCQPETQSHISANTSNPDYSSINYLSSAKNDTADPTGHYDDSHHISTDSEDENVVCDISIQVDKPQLCQAKQAHELVPRKRDASLVKNFLTTSDAPHLDNKALIQKLDEAAKLVDLYISFIFAEQIMEPVLGAVRSWIRKNTPLIVNDQKSKSPNVYYGFAKNSTDFLLKKRDNSFATMNHRTN